MHFKIRYIIIMYLIPSVYAHMLSGIILFVSVIYVGVHISKIMSKDPYQIAVLIILFSIAVSLHGMSHLGLESTYNFNPLLLFTERADQ